MHQSTDTDESVHCRVVSSVQIHFRLQQIDCCERLSLSAPPVPTAPSRVEFLRSYIISVAVLAEGFARRLLFVSTAFLRRQRDKREQTFSGWLWKGGGHTFKFCNISFFCFSRMTSTALHGAESTLPVLLPCVRTSSLFMVLQKETKKESSHFDATEVPDGCLVVCFLKLTKFARLLPWRPGWNHRRENGLYAEPGTSTKRRDAHVPTNHGAFQQSLQRGGSRGGRGAP